MHLVLYSGRFLAALSSSGGGEWGYQRELVMYEQSGDLLTDYQVLVELTGSNFPTNAQTDGDDIRFTDSSGTELSYWIEEWDYATKEAKIWVKVPSIPASGETTVTMWYGNPSAGAVSSVTNTFVREIGDVTASWNFNEGSGTVVHDTSGHGLDGPLYNNPAFVDKKFGKALSFEGNQGYMELKDNPALHLNIYTYEVWGVFNYQHSWWKTAIQYDGPWADYDGPRLSTVPWDHETVEMRRKFFFAMAKDNNDIVGDDSGYEADAIYSTTKAEQGRLFHVIVTRDEAFRTKIYIDGVLENEKVINITPLWNHGYKFWMGKGEGFDNSFAYNDNIMDEVRIYSRALSAAEVSDLYNNNGYTTAKYPGKVLVRKYADVEPAITVNSEIPIPSPTTPTPSPTPSPTPTPTPTPTVPTPTPSTPNPTSEPTEEPELSISQSSLKEEPEVGEDILVTVAILNKGKGSAQNIRLVENIPSSIAVNYVEGGEKAGSLVYWNGELDSGEAHSITHTLRILEEKNRIIPVTVTYEDASGTEHQQSAEIYLTAETPAQPSTEPTFPFELPDLSWPYLIILVAVVFGGIAIIVAVRRKGGDGGAEVTIEEKGE